MIPNKLYRGDDDKYQIRDLKKTLNHSQLQTNLLKGGIGHAVFTSSILDLVSSHVDPGWATTHFLSFSEDRKTGLRFGLRCDYEQVDEMIENYIEYYEDDQNWDFALITIDTANIQWRALGKGIYHGTFEPQLRKFKMFPGVYKIILIHVSEALNSQPDHPNFANVFSNAVRDKEWLVLPATETELNTGVMQFSGILDGACISEIFKYRRFYKTES